MAKPDVLGVRLFVKENSASQIHRGDNPVPFNVNNVCDVIEDAPEEGKEDYLASEDFADFCREENVIVAVSNSNDYSLRIITPDGVSEVNFFGDQKSHIKMSESVMLLDSLMPLVTKTKKPRPLPLDKVTSKHEKSVVADIFVNVRRVIDKNGDDREVMAVWCPQYPTRRLTIKGKSQDHDVAVFSAKTLRLVPTLDSHLIKQTKGIR